ncbi:hypothetical protein INR49_008175 [Caranx melampygus]|nr:hypothetical protein INR49_008175 [Caranx melampygus]
MTRQRKCHKRWDPTGFLCLCGSQSELRQAEQKEGRIVGEAFMLKRRSGSRRFRPSLTPVARAGRERTGSPLLPPQHGVETPAFTAKERSPQRGIRDGLG